MESKRDNVMVSEIGIVTGCDKSSSGIIYILKWKEKVYAIIFKT